MIPPATPIGWEAEAPTWRLPVIAELPVAAHYGTGPFAVPPRVLSPARHVAGMLAGVLAVPLALALLGAMLQLTGATVG